MTLLARRPADTYSPLYFLASVGAGGLAVSFFMYLLFFVPHPDKSVPVFEDIARAFTTKGLPMQATIVIAMIGIAIFSTINLYMLGWNLSRYGAFVASERGDALSRSNAETQKMAMPLALAMSVNVAFILGLVFVPGLWSVVEYLFPMALVAFTLIGVVAFAQLGRFLGRVLGEGGFACAQNNSFAQLLPAFTLAMIGVGLSAPGAMTSTALTAGVSIVLSTFFLVASVIIAIFAVVLGFRAMMEHGASAETAPTLLVVVPLATVLGILLLRQAHGLHVHFEVHSQAGDTLVLLSRLLSIQLVFMGLGIAVLARLGYAGRFLFGSERSAASYTLVCPGVALSVMIHFWLNKGLVAAHVIDKFSPAYWAIVAVAIAIQFATIWLALRLNRQHFSAPANNAALAAAE